MGIFAWVAATSSCPACSGLGLLFALHFSQENEEFAVFQVLGSHFSSFLSLSQRKRFGGEGGKTNAPAEACKRKVDGYLLVGIYIFSKAIEF